MSSGTSNSATKVQGLSSPASRLSTGLMQKALMAFSCSGVRAAVIT